MLKLKYLFENFDLARKCLASYDYDENSLDDMFRYFRISSNAIYPFRKKSDFNKVCFLRLSPVEEKSLSEVESEIKLINYLIQNGFNAMKPVPMKNGKLVDVINSEWGSYNVSCFEKVLGKDLEEIEGNLDIVKGYGECLGKMHQLLKKYPFAEERRDHKAVLEEIQSRLETFKAKDFVFTEFNNVKNELDKLPITIENYGVIHYDFEPDNVFYDAKSKAFSVIDFDDSIRCWYSLDVVRAIDALDDVVEDELVEKASSAFLDGYRTVCEFTQNQEDALPLMRRFVALNDYSTILYVMSESMGNEPEWLIALKKKLNFILGKLEERMK